MGRKTQEQLLKELEIAKTRVVVGGYYAHYKHPDKKEYQVTDLAIYENTEEVCVIYKSLTTEISWVRTVDNFLENGRFKIIE